MDYLKLIFLSLQIGFSLFQYFTSKAADKDAAAAAMAALFAQTEKMGYPVITDILVRTGRSSWVPWGQIPEQNLGAADSLQPSANSQNTGPANG